MRLIGDWLRLRAPGWSATAATLSMLGLGTVQAKEASDPIVLEQITVTAQKRSQNLQDVGVSVTAFSSDQLEQLGVANTIDIAAQVPSLQYQSFSPSFTVFNIRGVSQNNFADNLEAPVAVHIDGAYIATPNVIGSQLFDTERVEVLRGPQGTLFGRNATGGLLHFISKAPTRASEAYVEGSVSEFNSSTVEGAAGGPLSERVAGRLSARWEKSDGYLENIFPGARDGRGKDGYATRGQLLFDVSDDFSALLKGFYSEDNNVPDGYYVSAVSRQDPQTGLGIIAEPPRNVHQTNSNFQGFLDRKTYGSTLTLTKEFNDALELVAISNYLNSDKAYGEDSDISPDSFFIFLTDSRHEQWSQEIRLSGNGERTRWQAGVYYLDISSDNGAFNGGADPVNIVSAQPHNPGFNAGPGCPENPPGLDLNCGPLGHTETDFRLNSSNYSAFGQLEYDLSDAWTAIIGYRWTHDDKDFNYHLVEYNSGGGIGEEVFYNPATSSQAEISWSDWAGRAQLNWRPAPGTLFFASWNRGVKGGNWAAPTFVVDAQASIAEGIVRHDEETLRLRSWAPSSIYWTAVRVSTPRRSTMTTITTNPSR